MLCFSCWYASTCLNNHFQTRSSYVTMNMKIDYLYLQSMFASVFNYAKSTLHIFLSYYKLFYYLQVFCYFKNLFVIFPFSYKWHQLLHVCWSNTFWEIKEKLGFNVYLIKKIWINLLLTTFQCNNWRIGCRI